MDDAKPKRLIILLRGWTNKDDPFVAWLAGNGGEIPPEFVEFLESGCPDAEVCVPELDLGMFSLEEPKALVDIVLNQIDAATKDNPERPITVIGFSSGGLLARSLLVRAHGMRTDGTLDLASRKPWANNIDRWIGLAAILRGWSITSETTIVARLLGPPLLLFVRLLAHLQGKEPLVAKLERGHPDVVGARLQLIELDRLASVPDETGIEIRLPDRINLLGTQDHYVSPADCLELSHGHDSSEVFLEVPSTNHLDMLQVAGPGADAAGRRKIIAVAMNAPMSDIKEQTDIVVERDDLNDFFDELDRPHHDLLDESASRVKDAVLILHGIRDHGFWTKRIARRLKQDDLRPLLRAPTPSYGYFTLLDFMNPWRRRRQARWLLEQYADIRSCYRNARVSFVGHSNGTYLMKCMMDICPAVRLHRVYLAGSVLRTDLSWDAYDINIGDGVLNVRAVGDFVVGALPYAMQRLGLRYLDIGGAGYAGFDTMPKLVRLDDRVAAGDHTGGVAEPWWPRIAGFIKNGEVWDSDDVTFQGAGAGHVAALVRIAPISLTVLAVVLVFGWIKFASTVGFGIGILVLILMERILRRF